ncbi:MAG: hypothetical protein QME59_02785 [Candidatus Hydrothermarchaeota archaeon]|nr:hypothetical protein [Candidatus Hydrothermarchaeota archaeon]
MRCGECGTKMEEKKEVRLGEEMTVYHCPKCKKSLVGLDDAIKLQRRFIKAVEEDRKIVKIGNSIGVTFPSELKEIFRLGEKVKLRFDPKKMEVSVRTE